MIMLTPCDDLLSDQAVGEALERAFAPHRCDVAFQTDAFTETKKVALVIRVLHNAGTREFVVEGISVDTLRRPDALLAYVDDVRRQLRQRKVVFSPVSRTLLAGQDRRGTPRRSA